MDSTSPELLAAMRTRLRYLGERQAVISKNIANANTPDYHAQDLQSPSFSQLVSGAGSDGVKLKVTSDNHIRPSNSSAYFKLIEHEADESSPDGNSVVLEEQMMNMAKTNLDYQTTINLYTKMGSMIKAALGRGQ